MIDVQSPFLPQLEGLRNLAHAFEVSASRPGATLRLVQSATSEECIGLADLKDRAMAVLGSMQERGIRQGDALVLVTDDLALFTAAFWAAVLGGIKVVPIAVPSNDAGRTKLSNVVALMDQVGQLDRSAPSRTSARPWLAADRPEAVAAHIDTTTLPLDRRVLLSRSIFDAPKGLVCTTVGPDEPVLIQFSSGSTGQPKGVQITSRNLLANVSCFADAFGLDSDDDRLLNWMPLTHDFGIVFCHLTPTVLAVDHTLIATPAFMRHPLLWMQKASDLKATATAGPNYAYHHFLKRYKADAHPGWDLSSLRIVVNGAEPISCDLSREFFAEMARFGLSPMAAKPGYGLAEATLMVSVSRARDPFRSLRLDRRQLSPGSAIETVAQGEAQGLEFACVGPPGRNVELRITDGRRQPLPEGVVGTVETRGACVSPGYLGRDDLTEQVISPEGWLDTGDLGFLHEGLLYITGRRKDLIIINGVNYYPHDIESAAAEVPPLDLNAVAACAVSIPHQNREGLALFVRNRGDDDRFHALAEQLRDHVLQRMGLPVDHVLAVRQIPKTTSGKVQRFQLVRDFDDGQFDAQIDATRQRRQRSELRQAWDLGDIRRLQHALKQECTRLVPHLDWSAAPMESQPLMELGMGSLRLVELLQRINASLGLDLPISVMFENASVMALCARLLELKTTADATDVETAAQQVRHQAAEAHADVAIVGMACRFPGPANTPDEFWQLLLNEVDATCDFPSDRWDRAFNAEAVTDRGAYLAHLERFDHRFFRLTPAEALALDPQQRLLLTVSWEAFEQAGLDPMSLRGSETGVFTGISGSDYAQAQARASLNDIGPYAFTGTAGSVASGRLSYFYGLEGPNVAVDTACSSALAAVHLAVKALRSGDCDLALASAVNLILSPELQVGLSRMNALSPEGRCRAFDAAANGYARGEGCAAVVLQRLDNALKTGAPVLAVIRGSAMNHDGASNGLTAPNGAAQQKVIRAALRDARWSPGAVDYVEAHGTGTPLGDPVEAMALSAAYGGGRTPDRPLRIGSVKTNVAHLEAAAGMASLLKVVLALQNGQWPATLHVREPNPLIPWQTLSLQVVDRLQAWQPAKEGVARRAGISSFGMSGTNVHLLLEQAPPASTGFSAAVETDRPALLLLSAQSRDALTQWGSLLGQWLQQHPHGVHDLACTLARHRASLPVRAAVVGVQAERLAVELQGLAHSPRAEPTAAPQVVFVFPGQGSQQPGALQPLWDREPVFRQSLEWSAAVLQDHMRRPLVPLLLESDAEVLSRTEYTQAAAVATGLALWDLWQHWGVAASGVLGHSVGEIAACAAAGAIPREAALLFAARRGALMQNLEPGAMLGVGAGVHSVRACIGHLLGERLSLAAINGENAITLSGSVAAIEQAQADLQAQGLRCSRLAVSHAFHSALLDPALEGIRALAKDALPTVLAPRIRLISCVTGLDVDVQAMRDPQFWVRHARDPVQFAQAVQVYAGDTPTVFVELGARPVFATLAAQEWPGQPWLSTAQSRQALDQTVLLALGRAHELGIPFDRRAVFAHSPGRLTPLPTYPFQGTTPMLSTVKQVPAPALTHEQAHSHKSAASAPATAHQTSGSPARSQAVQQTLRQLVCKVSGLNPEDVQPQVNWFSLGMDSLLVLQLQQALNKALGTDIKLNDIFEMGTNLEDLTGLVLRHLPAEASTAPPPSASMPPSESGAPLTGGGDLEALLTAQVQAMSRLFQQQLAVLQGGGLDIPAGMDHQAVQKAQTMPAEPMAMATEPAQARASAPAQLSAPAKLPAEVKGLYKQIPGRKAEWSAARAEHVKTLADAYVDRTPGSRNLTAAGRSVYANPRAVIGFRPEWKEMTYPLHVQRAEGAHVWDVDGHRYVDITMGFGATLLGHNPPFIRKAIEDELAMGAPLGPQTPHAVEVARLIADMTGSPRVAFFTTGSEAVMVAVRLARAVTHRQRIVIFTNSYHGTFDGFLAMGWVDDGKPQSYPLADGTPPKMVEDVAVLRYGDPRSLQIIRDMGQDLAAVLVEPVQSRDPAIQPTAFLHELRGITADCGAALIFDEMIMGFRVHPGGAQHHFGVRADICTYGKVVGGGMPIGVVAGEARFLDAIDGGQWQYGDDSVPSTRTAFVAGTFNNHPLSMVAARAVLQHLKERGPELQERLNRRTAEMARRLNELFEDEQVPIRCVHFSSLFRFEFSDDTEVLNYHLLQQGVFVWEGRNCFLSTAHSDEDVEFIVQAVRLGVRAMQEGGYLSRARQPAEQIA